MNLNPWETPANNEILIVDDTAANLKLLSDILTNAGYSVRPASSGELALRSLKAKLPSLILLDVRMPDMDGFELCSKLKADEITRDIPVIFISALEDETSRVQGFHAGGVDFIKKPFQPEEVLARVKTHISLRQMQLNLEKQNSLLFNEISERRQAEEELLEQKRFFEQAFSQSSVSTQILDKDGWCEKINLRLSELFGVKPEDIEGKVYNIFKDEAIIQGGILPYLEKVFHEGKPAEWEIFFDIGLAAKSQDIKVAEKKKVWFHNRAYPVLDHNGRLVNVIIQHTDITERKQAEEELRESETHFRTLANSGQALIWTSGVDKKCNYFNQTWLNFTGRMLEQELGDGWVEGVHHDDLQQCIEIYVSAFDRREKFSMEYRIRHASGEYRWIQDDGAPRCNSKGEFIGYIGYCLDVNERKHIEEQIIQLSQAVKQSPATIVITDLNGNIEYVNPKFTETTGYTYEEALAQNPRILKSGEKSTDEYKELWETITSGKEWHGEFHNRRKNGKLYWEFASISPIRNKKGAITHFLAIKEDITERKQAELQLQKYAGELKIANETKNKFFSIIAHDLKNPFSGIIGLSEYLKEEAHQLDRDKIAEYAELVNSAAVETLRLLENLLDWARLQQNAITFDPSEFSVVEVVQEVINLLAENAGQKSISLIYNIPAGLNLLADRNMVTTIIRNLVSNAIKFSPFNKLIKIQSVETETSVKISVIDQGNGISKENQHKLFKLESNFSTHGTNNEKGTGLGLILCKEFITKHGGEIRVESEEGKGSEFCFTIPKN
jgi:PAS domain S-box-containing protein